MGHLGLSAGCTLGRGTQLLGKVTCRPFQIDCKFAGSLLVWALAAAMLRMPRCPVSRDANAERWPTASTAAKF